MSFASSARRAMPHPQPGTTRRVRLRDQRGLMLVEIITALVVFAVLAAAFSMLMASSFTAQDGSRERTVAEQLALEQLETIRRLPYESVGVVNGNPPGTVQVSRSISVAGLTATMTTAISYVNDPGPLAYSATANYKRVTVTVTRTRDSAVLARQQTYISPTTRANLGGINTATINVLVVDAATNDPVGGATVNIGSGPSAGRSDTTDAAGTASFVSLTANPISGPQSHYDVTVAPPSGYSVHAADLPPAAVAHVSLAPGQVFSTVLRVYRPSSLRVTIPNWSGDIAYVSVGSSAGAERFLYTGGTLEITQIAGQPLAPGQYSIAAYQEDNVSNNFSVSFSPTSVVNLPGANPALPTDVALEIGPIVTHKRVTVIVRDSLGAPVGGARVDLSGGPNPGVYVTGTSSTDTTNLGQVSFHVPSGNGFTITAWGATGPSATPWTGAITSSPTLVTVNVQ